MNASQRLHEEGHSPLLQCWPWSSSGTDNFAAPAGLHTEALADEVTINTTPGKTLLAFADHGEGQGVLSRDGGHVEAVPTHLATAGVNDHTLAAGLQWEGAAIAKSRNERMLGIASEGVLP